MQADLKAREEERKRKRGYVTRKRSARPRNADSAKRKDALHKKRHGSSDNGSKEPMQKGSQDALTLPLLVPLQEENLRQGPGVGLRRRNLHCFKQISTTPPEAQTPAASAAPKYTPGAFRGRGGTAGGGWRERERARDAAGGGVAARARTQRDRQALPSRGRGVGTPARSGGRW